MRKAPLVWFAIVMSVISGGLMLSAGPGQVESISVNDGRPLAAALRAFEGLYGWIVTYEDPLYQNEGDLIDVTEQVRRPGSASKMRVLVPRGGAFSFNFERPAPDSTRTQISDLLTAMVAEFNDAAFPGTFQVVRTEDILHVVPVSVRGRSGGPVSQQSILATRVSLEPMKNRNALDTIRALLAIVQSRTGLRIEVGMVPINLMLQSTAEEGAMDEAARDVLLRILRATGRGASWQLYYAADFQKYVLNIHLVKSP